MNISSSPLILRLDSASEKRPKFDAGRRFLFRCSIQLFAGKKRGGGYQVTNSHSQTFRQQSLSLKLSFVRPSLIIFKVCLKIMGESFKIL